MKYMPGGHTPEKARPGKACYMFDIDHPPFVKIIPIVEVCRTLHIFFFHVENRLGIFHFVYTNRLGGKAEKAHRGN